MQRLVAEVVAWSSKVHIPFYLAAMVPALILILAVALLVGRQKSTGRRPAEKRRRNAWLAELN